MMRDICYDTEFHHNGKTIDLLSIAMANERGEEYYAIVKDDDAITRAFQHPWLPDNVLKHFPIKRDENREWVWQTTHPDFQHVKLKENIAREVHEFILGDGTERAQLWAYFSAFDHVALTQLWGDFVDMPHIIPHRTNCLAQEAASLRLRHKPAEPLNAHDARVDARWNVELLALIKQRRQELGL